MESAGKNLLPKGSEVILTLEFLDKALKLEVILDFLHNLLFISSFLEIVILGFFFVFSLRKPKQFYFWAMHTPHFLHSFWGFALISKLPKSHDIVELLRPEKGTEHHRPQNIGAFEADM